MDTEMKSNPEMKQSVSSIRVATEVCGPDIVPCTLDEPADGTRIYVEPPYVIDIVNARDCWGQPSTVVWYVNGKTGTLEQRGGRYRHRMEHDEETLTLSYSECDGIPDSGRETSLVDPARPRVTITLVKKGDE